MSFRIQALAVSAALISSFSGNSALAGSPCRKVTGSFSAVKPAECRSPVGICTSGFLKGKFNAAYEFTAEAIYPANDPLQPNKFIYIGSSEIFYKGKQKAKLYARDSGHLFLKEDGTALFETTVTFTEGTGKFKEHSGGLVASGLMSFITGKSEGSYSGSICRDDD